MVLLQVRYIGSTMLCGGDKIKRKNHNPSFIKSVHRLHEESRRKKKRQRKKRNLSRYVCFTEKKKQKGKKTLSHRIMLCKINIEDTDIVDVQKKKKIAKVKQNVYNLIPFASLLGSCDPAV